MSEHKICVLDFVLEGILPLILFPIGIAKEWNMVLLGIIGLFWLKSLVALIGWPVFCTLKNIFIYKTGVSKALLILASAYVGIFEGFFKEKDEGGLSYDTAYSGIDTIKREVFGK